MSEPEAVASAVDPLHPAQRVYAAAVVAAEREYRRACHEAWVRRQSVVDEALATCELAMREESHA